MVPFLLGGQCLTNDILPNVDVDYVSYSSYDAIQGDIHEGLFAALNHIESKLRPKPGVPGKRVFIGEYGFPTRRYTPEEQNRKSLEVMLAGIEWGCLFVLYWELYCNELTDGKPGGFWLIDDRNRRQPIWRSHELFFEWARKGFSGVGREAENPSFREAAARYLRDQLTGFTGPD